MEAFKKWFNQYKPYPMEGEEHLAATAWDKSEKRMLEFSKWVWNKPMIKNDKVIYYPKTIQEAFDYWQENIEGK